MEMKDIQQVKNELLELSSSKNVGIYYEDSNDAIECKALVRMGESYEWFKGQTWAEVVEKAMKFKADFIDKPSSMLDRLKHQADENHGRISVPLADLETLLIELSEKSQTKGNK